jgi:hypothetical protein
MLQDNAVAQVNAAYATALSSIPNGPSKDKGVAVGHAAAAAILARRSTDHATTPVTYIPGTRPGDWQPTPNPVPPNPAAPADLLVAVLPGWGQVTPFALRHSSQFEPDDGPPPLTSRRYARDYNEVKAIGEQHGSMRTDQQSTIARFWYEGSATGWSRIARVVGQSQNLNLWDTARLLALVDMAMADGYIAGFATKYDFNFWRPVTAIRADTDGNNRTLADPNWSTYLNTPAIPDYPSTHSVAGGAASEVLRRFFHDDDIAFTMTSGAPFAGIMRSFDAFSQAAQENGESRIYAGIHFRSAVDDGIKQGKKIGRFAFTHTLRRLNVDDEDDDDDR